MTRYIIRRILYMFPILAGVLLVTFVLFNVVGGSPAAMALGKNVSPQALEEFDEQHGFNKPVIAGWWTSTRAFNEITPRSELHLPAGTNYPLALQFPLRADTVYRLRAEVRGGAGVAKWVPAKDITVLGSSGLLENQRTPGPAPLLSDGLNGGRMSPSASSPMKVELVFRTGSLPVTVPVSWLVGDEAIAVTSLRLQRKMAHWYDSQLFHFLGKLAKWDLGISLATNEKVTAMLKRGIGPSLALTVPIFSGGLVLSVGLALVCAYWRNRLLDRVLVITAVMLMSVNYLVWIIFGQFFLAYALKWFPIWGFESWRYLLLPVFIGVVSGLGSNLRFYRTVILDEMYKDYVRTAYAKGLGPVAVLFKHVLPNAMIPIVTNTALALPFLYTGSLLLESFFGIPGLGGLSVNAINSADVDVVRGVVLVGAILYVVASLLTDLCYAWVDPRVKLK